MNAKHLPKYLLAIVPLPAAAHPGHATGILDTAAAAMIEAGWWLLPAILCLAALLTKVSPAAQRARRKK